MKLLHVVPSFGIGGMEKVICAFIKHTTPAYQHSILALDNNTQAGRWLQDEQVRFLNFEKPAQRRRFFRALAAALRQARPDLLMTYTWGATDAIWLGRLAGIRHIVHNEHGFNVDESRATLWTRDVIRLLVYRLASKVIVVSHELQTLLQRKYLLTADRVIRIPNGIDTSYYAPDPEEQRRVRKSLGFTDAHIVVGFSGRLDPIKNFDLLLHIFASCTRKNPHVKLLIVGDGPEKQRLETWCYAKRVHKSVVFAGQQENVLPYLRAMDVFLLTSLREQMPMTILEAMAVGVPVIASRVGEIPHMIDDRVNGFVHSLNDPVETFVQPLLSLFSPAYRKRIGAAARQKIVESFQQETMVQRYQAMIEGLL
ncbi:MAG TPA: glycosyltransferase [Candidatus Tectomicrobia bacterium]